MAKYRTMKPNNRRASPALALTPAARFLAPNPKSGPVRIPPGIPVKPAPAPAKPPGGPLFKPYRPKRLPFGKRLPPGIGRLPPSILQRLGPWGFKLLPWVGAAITAYEIYDWMNNPDVGPDRADLTPYGGILCCKDSNVFPLDSYAASTQSSDSCGGVSALCGTPGQVRNGVWPPRAWTAKSSGTARYVLLLGKANLAMTRQTHGEIWVFPRGPSNKGISIPATKPFIPELPSITMPDWLVPPVPFAPMPIPLAPPLTWPDPDPNPEEPTRPPLPSPDPPIFLPPSNRPSVPAIITSPGMPNEPGHHYPVPPAPNERERKKRLKPDLAHKWYKFIEKLGGSYMEFDDNVAALYKGLHWSVRRWRGRDGVWRDRDITSTARMERIFSYAATVKFSVNDALNALATEQVTDWAFGKIGNAIKQKTKDNADTGFWAGARGPSSRPDDNQWSEAYKKLQRERYQRNKKLRKFTSWREAQNGKWVRMVKERPDTQIPWFKQKSNYPAPLRLRGNQLKGGFGRNYYAPNATQRPRTIKGLR